MSRKKDSDSFPYTFISLQSQMQQSPNDIFLRMKPQTSKNNKSASHSRGTSVISETNINESDASSILRPMTIEKATPPIYKRYNKSNHMESLTEETPIKRKNGYPSPLSKEPADKKSSRSNNDSFSLDIVKEKIKDLGEEENNEEILQRNVFIEEEEADSDTNVSDIIDDPSTHYLDTLIDKIKSKSQDSKQNSISAYLNSGPTAPKDKEAEFPDNLQEYVQKKSEIYDQKTLTIKNKCYGLDKYLEENGYNDIESESERARRESKLSTESNKEYSDNKGEKESDYAFEPQERQEQQNPRNLEHFFIFNLDEKLQSNASRQTASKASSRAPSKASSKQGSPSSAKEAPQPQAEDKPAKENAATRYTLNSTNDLLANNQNNSESVMSFSSSNGQYSSPSRRNRSFHSSQSPNSPRLSPRLQQMKENPSSRGTSPDAKMLRDRAIGNAFLNMRDAMISCNLDSDDSDDSNRLKKDNSKIDQKDGNTFDDDYNDENEEIDIQFDRKSENKPLKKKSAVSENSSLSKKSKTVRDDSRATPNRKSKTLNRGSVKPAEERRNKSEIKERNLSQFTPTINRKNESGKRQLRKTPNTSYVKKANNSSITKKKRIIYAEHVVQTEDVSEDEL